MQGFVVAAHGVTALPPLSGVHGQSWILKGVLAVPNVAGVLLAVSEGNGAVRGDGCGTGAEGAGSTERHRGGHFISNSDRLVHSAKSLS